MATGFIMNIFGTLFGVVYSLLGSFGSILG